MHRTVRLSELAIADPIHNWEISLVCCTRSGLTNSFLHPLLPTSTAIRWAPCCFRFHPFPFWRMLTRVPKSHRKGRRMFDRGVWWIKTLLLHLPSVVDVCRCGISSTSLCNIGNVETSACFSILFWDLFCCRADIRVRRGCEDSLVKRVKFYLCSSVWKHLK